MSDNPTAVEPRFPLHWTRKLEDVAAELKAQVGDRESDFLSLGSRLQEFLERITALSASASGLSELAAGPEVRQAVATLSAELEALVGMIEAGSIQARLDNMEGIAAASGSLFVSLDKFKHTVKSLQMLGISTRIESARLGRGGMGFNTLADDVEKLAGKIVVDAAKVRDRTREVVATVAEAKGKGLDIAETRKASALSICESIRRNIATLTSVIESSAEMSEGVALRMNGIGRTVSEIVLSLQFHDIVRQQAEHVSKTLVDTAGYLGSSQSETEAGEACAWMADVCGLEASQVASAGDRFFSAVEQVRASIGSVSDAVGSICDDIRSTLGTVDGSGRTTFSRIEEDLGRAADAMADFTRQGESFEQVMGAVSGMVEEMTASLSDIEEMGAEIELISLNASIKSAQIGCEGMALGVIASAIQRLSVDARSLTEEVTATLVGISTSARVLDKGAHRDVDAETSRGMISRQRELVGTLHSTEDRMRLVLASILAEGDRLGRNMVEAANSVGFHEEVRGRLETARRTLEHLGAQAEKLAGGVDRARRSERLKELYSLYTMEAERIVHAACDADGDYTGGSCAEADGSDLGDNFELF
jgi:methyl-accepting chemotaxis protein